MYPAKHTLSHTRFTFRSVRPTDTNALHTYFRSLSPETRRRFGPHDFDEHTARTICEGQMHRCTAYIGLHEGAIIAYAIVLQGYTRGDYQRYLAYDLPMSDEHDYTLAPSVADAWQSQGVGNQLYAFIEEELRQKGAQKIVLWGGVQLSNQRAVRFYLKQGFRTLAQFEHQGTNLDMVHRL